MQRFLTNLVLVLIILAVLFFLSPLSGMFDFEPPAPTVETSEPPTEDPDAAEEEPATEPEADDGVVADEEAMEAEASVEEEGAAESEGTGEAEDSDPETPDEEDIPAP